MKIKIRRILSVCLALLMLINGVTGCGRHREPKEGETALYYINAEGTDLVKEAYKITGDSRNSRIRYALKSLKKEPDTIEYKSAFQNHTAVKSWSVTAGKMDLHLNDAFGKMNTTSRLLLEAAVVQTLTQIDGVGYVRFYQENKPVKDEHGKPEGYLCAADFVQNTGSSLHSYQSADLLLYYANAKGDKLKEESVKVRYDSNTALEKVIVEQLVKGPEDASEYPVISQDTEILSVSTKDGICYVNLDEECQNTKYKIDPRLSIYAIVNSITANGAAGKVQILIGGKANVQYQGSINLNNHFRQIRRSWRKNSEKQTIMFRVSAVDSSDRGNRMVWRREGRRLFLSFGSGNLCRGQRRSFGIRNRLEKRIYRKPADLLSYKCIDTYSWAFAQRIQNYFIQKNKQ